MANKPVNPMSFRPRIDVSEEFVIRMIDLYLELEVKSRSDSLGRPKQPSKSDFNTWYIDQVKAFGTDSESQGLRDLISDDARELFRRWYA